MIVQDILRVKGTEVHTIRPDATLEDVVLELVRYNVGSLVVMETSSEAPEPRMVGIITERDILRAQAAHQASLDQLKVENVMSTDLVTALLGDELQEVMRLMTEHRIRHLPVVGEGRLRGVISIGDIVKAHHDQLEMENHYMRSYIQGEGAELGTAPDRR
jgi:CBS domain-containing protein